MQYILFVLPLLKGAEFHKMVKSQESMVKLCFDF
jgi:hypothetical protein